MQTPSSICRKLLNIHSLDNLAAQEYAELVKLLLHTEEAPGGPYTFSASIKENVRVNFHIYQLFLQQNKELTTTATYLQQHKQFLSVQQAQRLQSGLLIKTKTTNLTYSYNNKYIKIAALLQKHLPTHSHPKVMAMLKKIYSIDYPSGEISELSAACLTSNLAISAHFNKISQRLGQANVLIWLSYSLLDEVLDTNASQADIPTILLVRQVALNLYTSCKLDNPLLSQLLETVDRAHSDEMHFCRMLVADTIITITPLPSMHLLRRLLHERSIVHTFGPHALLLKTPSKKPDNHSAYLQTFLQKYCAVRQLNDDIHDWEDDLRNGRTTYVVAHLLKACKIDPGQYNLDTLIPQLRTAFWNSELDLLLHKALKIAKESESAAQKLKITNKSPLYQITLHPIIASLEEALLQHQRDKQLLHRMKF